MRWSVLAVWMSPSSAHTASHNCAHKSGAFARAKHHTHALAALAQLRERARGPFLAKANTRADSANKVTQDSVMRSSANSLANGRLLLSLSCYTFCVLWAEPQGAYTRSHLLTMQAATVASLLFAPTHALADAADPLSHWQVLRCDFALWQSAHTAFTPFTPDLTLGIWICKLSCYTCNLREQNAA